eukprot:jgi/Chlat1/3488/Chrsp23S03679
MADVDGEVAAVVSRLLAPPSAEDVQAYYQAEVGAGLAVRYIDATLSKGVIATRNFGEGDVLVKEPKLVGAQHFANKAVAHVCSHCFQYIGSVEQQIGRRILVLSTSTSPHHAHGETSHTCSDEEQEEQEQAQVDDDDDDGNAVEISSEVQHLASQLTEGSIKLPFTEDFALPEAVACPGGCEDEAFCSTLCAEAEWEFCHQLLCNGTGSNGNARALTSFKAHANETNDIFHVIAATALRYLRLSEGKRPHSESAGVIIDLLMEAWRPFGMGHKAKWSECVAAPEEMSVNEVIQFGQQLKELAGESLSLLSDAIGTYDPVMKFLLQQDVYESIVGMFELNNLDMVVESPVERYFLHMDGQAPQLKAITQPLLDALGPSYADHCEGTCFFPIQSCMNHSCNPNAHAFKRDEDTNGSAVILAKRPILASEQVMISYIDEHEELEDRQAALADYGFHCECEKCRAGR